MPERAHVARDSAADLSTREETNDLIAYLVVRFVLVLVVVMLAESFVVWVESLALPVLQSAFGAGDGSAAPTTSLLALIGGVLELFWHVVRGDASQLAGGPGRTLAALLVLFMLVLLLVPPLLGAFVFSRLVVRKVRGLQERRELELAQADRRRSQFLTDVAHDLRSPLMAISGMAHAISDGVVRDDETREEYLRSICEKADKMGGLVSSVFDYAKLGGGSYVLEREVVDLPELLLREAAAAYADVEGAGMHFSVEVPEDPCQVFADPVQLGRIVANLLVNAVRHNGAGIPHIGFGALPNRIVLDPATFGQFNLQLQVTDEYWAVTFDIPVALLDELYGFPMDFESGTVVNGNFQKCLVYGGKEDHAAVWNPIPEEVFAFHKPEYFGALIMD